MNGNWTIGRIWGIPIALHWSMWLVLGLLTTSLAGGSFADAYPQLSEPARWLLAALTGALLFGSILLHELGHAFVARRNRLPVERISLFIFGGTAQVGQRAPSAGVELRVALAGPVVSLVLFVLFTALHLLDRGVAYLAAPSEWLARINLLLFLFNLIPGYPLDGGRVLRALVWHGTKHEGKATRVASVTGQAVALGVIGVGAVILFAGDAWQGIWLIVIGWFLQGAALAETMAVTTERTLEGVTVGQAMTRDVELISPRTRVRQLIEERVLTGGQRFFVVGDEAGPRGVVTLADLQRVRRDRWDWAAVTEVMAPWPWLPRVGPEVDLMTALRWMGEEKLHHLVVVDGDRFVGVLTHEVAANYLRVRAELERVAPKPPIWSGRVAERQPTSA